MRERPLPSGDYFMTAMHVGDAKESIAGSKIRPVTFRLLWPSAYSLTRHPDGPKRTILQDTNRTVMFWFSERAPWGWQDAVGSWDALHELRGRVFVVRVRIADAHSSFGRELGHNTFAGLLAEVFEERP